MRITIVTNKIPHTLFNNTNENIASHYRLFLDDLIHEGSSIHEILNTLHNAGDEDTLEVRINSRGGYIKYGHPFINIMRGKFKGRCITVIECDALSMGGMIFMAADTRIIYEHSSLMVHDLSSGTLGKASDSKKQLEAETYAFTVMLNSLYREVLTKQEIEKVLNGVDFWFNAKEMCARGMATHIITDEHGLLTTEEYTKFLANPLAHRRKELEEKMEALNEECSAIIEEYTEKLNILQKDLKLLQGDEVENSDSGQAAIKHEL